MKERFDEMIERFVLEHPSFSEGVQIEFPRVWSCFVFFSKVLALITFIDLLVYSNIYFYEVIQLHFPSVLHLLYNFSAVEIFDLHIFTWPMFSWHIFNIYYHANVVLASSLIVKGVIDWFISHINWFFYTVYMGNYCFIYKFFPQLDLVPVEVINVFFTKELFYILDVVGCYKNVSYETWAFIVYVFTHPFYYLCKGSALYVFYAVWTVTTATALFISFFVSIGKYLFAIPFGMLFSYLMDVNFSSYETIYHLYGFSEPASEKMYTIIEMYHNTAIILSYIFVVIFVIIGLSIKLFRADVNRIAISFDKRVEYLLDALFVIAPIIIVYYLTIPAVSFILHSDRMSAQADTLFSIEIVGHQWYWSYFISAINSNYLFNLCYLISDESLIHEAYGQTITLEFDQMIDNEVDVLTRCFEVNKHLILPVNERIRCFITSEDVIHSWALPQLGIKVDAIPGRVQAFMLSSLKTGVFYGQCSELCGVNHAFMPIVVEFVELESFFDWLLKETKYRPYKALLSNLF